MRRKDTEIAAKVAHAASQEGSTQKAEERSSLMSTTIRKHGPKLHTCEAARCSAEGALHSSESSLQDICMSESSLQEGVNRLQSDKTRLEKQCKLDALCGGRACD